MYFSAGQKSDHHSAGWRYYTNPYSEEQKPNVAALESVKAFSGASGLDLNINKCEQSAEVFILEGHLTENYRSTKEA